MTTEYCHWFPALSEMEVMPVIAPVDDSICPVAISVFPLVEV